MREIKFRAWDSLEKKMVKVYAILFYYRADGSTLVSIQTEHEADRAVRFAIMQYTGLKDKNGKEIYEGDIVSAGDFTGQVFWNSFSCGFRFAKTPDLDIEKTAFLNSYASSEYTVIGNIYENPELLPGEPASSEM